MSEIIDLRAKMDEKEDKEKLNPTALTLTKPPRSHKKMLDRTLKGDAEKYYARIIELYTAGKEHREISDILNAEGILTPTGRKPTPEYVRGNIMIQARNGILTLRPLRREKAVKAIAEILSALPNPENGRLWHAILHSNEIDNDTRTEMLRLLATRRR